MNTQSKQSLNSFSREQGKYNNKKEQLKTYVKQSEYIDVLEQPKICEAFNLPYFKSIFQKIYAQRFIDYLMQKPSSRFEVFKATGIPEKYLCQVKKRLEKNGQLRVLYIGYCKVAKENNIQILSTNPKHWNDLSFLPKSNQLKMF